MRRVTVAATGRAEYSRAPTIRGTISPRGRDRGGEQSVDIAAWLHGLGLQQYEQAFCDNAIDSAVLPELTADDLKELGVRLVGHRRKLLAAIAALRSDIVPVLDRPEAASTANPPQPLLIFCGLVHSTALSSRLD